MPKTVVVIGGGITGLSACFHLTRATSNPKVILLEASGRLGGWVQSTRTEDGAIFEHGPRGVRPAGTVGKNTLQMVSELGLENKLLPVQKDSIAAKNRFLYVGGKLCRLPSSFSGICKTQEPFTKPLISHLLREPLVSQSKEPDESVYSFALRRFGKEIADNAIDSLCRGIFAGDCRQLSLRSCFPILYTAERGYGSVLLGMLLTADQPHQFRSPLISRALTEGWTQWSLQGGMQTLPEALEDDLRKNSVEIHRDTTVSKIEPQSNGSWKINLENGSIRADHVISAVSSRALSCLLPPSLEALASELRQISSASVAVVNLEYQGNVLPITVMLGGAWFHEAFGSPEQANHKELLAVAKETIRTHLGVSAEPLRSILNIQQDSIAQYAVGHWKRLDTIYNIISDHALGLSLTGASYEGVSVNDCIFNARNIVEKLFS
ncbi:protoporphyrinogen oxidase isoform X3 [Callorhinchus milii]|uniref:protoporphyrinogen oxidase isoform X3 n=1 Tax=Callorhinchus milii TaxID=7868 RepID=UPI0004575F46|nr:protoporphyrinogen oxidase isoform X3 [Callorhinchus milii]|eukprot:gi/632982820/ref/XP_007908344.1/ PREDICTED: protoporphyrinogen oxidase isoform X2 [Callorhinchus milii]